MKDIFTNDKNRYHVIKYLNDFIKEYPKVKGLYLSGSFGSGKTYLISAAFNELAKNDIKSTIVFWPAFLKELKEGFYSNDNEKYHHTLKTPLLLIDDIGAETVTAWARDEILCPILQYRMDKKLPTFLTSNLNIEELSEFLSVTKNSVDTVKARRIIERIKQLCNQEELISENLRR
jgi:primosomal protein DnaI